MKPELLAQVQHGRALAHAISGRRPSRRVFARQVFPRAVEQAYATDLLGAVEVLRRQLVSLLKQHGPGWVEEYARVHQRLDKPADQLEDDLAIVKLSLERGVLAPPSLRVMARRAAERTQEAQKRELHRQLRVAVGVAVPVLDRDLGAQIDTFTSENVARVRGLSADALEDVKRTVLTGLGAGDRWEEIAHDLSARVDVAEARAVLIARDQVGKFYSALNRTRQQNLGLTHFTWNADDDERECDICGKLDGKRFAWRDLPAEGGPGEVHPNCRCSADPDVDELVDSL